MSNLTNKKQEVDNSRPLAELKGNSSPVTSTHEVTVDINDAASLADGPNMEHGLVLWFDGSCMR